MITLSSFKSQISAAAIVLVLAGCSYGSVDYDQFPGSANTDERVNGRTMTRAQEQERGGLFGSEGLNIFGGEDEQQGGGSGIGVNSFLWRASLDTLSFMPLNSADPFGGVIITDWYTPPESPDERFADRLHPRHRASFRCHQGFRVPPGQCWSQPVAGCSR